MSTTPIDKPKKTPKDVTTGDPSTPKKMPIPNTLTIYINTRIRNFPKIKYEPNMTVPNSKSTSVLFDPLIKLSNVVSRKLPVGAPPSERYTQFFNRNEFSGLISRTLMSSSQKKMTLPEATAAGYVDNNIHVTLDQLFAPNSIFNIKGQPYTVYSYTWNTGDWKVDTKSFERNMPYLPYGSPLADRFQRQNSITESEGQRELRNLEYSGVAQGTVASASWSKFKSPNNQFDPSVARRLTAEENEAIAKKDSQNVPEDLMQMASELVPITLVSNPDKPNFATSSLTQLVFYQKTTLQDEVDANKTALGESYSKLVDASENYSKKMMEYNRLNGIYVGKDTPTPKELASFTPTEDSIASNKKKYDEALTSLKASITEQLKTKSIIEILSDPGLKAEFTSKITEINEYKGKIFSGFLQSLGLLSEIIDAYKNYCHYSSVFFGKLKELKEKKSKKSGKLLYNNLFASVVDTDNQCRGQQIDFCNVLIGENKTDFKKIKENIEEEQRKVKQMNYRSELEKYLEFPKLCDIEKAFLNISIAELLSYQQKFYQHIFEIFYE